MLETNLNQRRVDDAGMRDCYILNLYPYLTPPCQPGLHLIDARPFSLSASLQCRPGPSQTTRDSLFVIYELVCGLC